MEKTQIKMLFTTLDDFMRVDENGIQCWFSNEVCDALGYHNHTDFLKIVAKGKIACIGSGGDVDAHFVEEKDAAGEVFRVKLTRYACYLTAVNGDSKKQEIAAAQAYFVTQTRQLEVIQKKIDDMTRLDAREKLKFTEKEFSQLMYERGVDGKGIGLIRSRGDQELFGLPKGTNVKEKFKLPDNKPLADVLPTVTLKAKDFAAAMTTENAKRKNLSGLTPIGKEHVDNNKSIRKVLADRGIYPENLPPEEDIKLIEMKQRKEVRDLKARHQKELADALKKQKK